MTNGYFDNNATTPLCDAAQEVWIEASERFWHNPSSLYREAAVANRRLEDAREELADLIGIEPQRILFTSGATESNNAVFQQFSERSKGRSTLISAMEHPSVLEPARKWFGAGRVVEFPVLEANAGDSESFEDRMKREDGGISLVSIMAANNETGDLLPWQEIAKTCREQGFPYHCDAAQWFGKLAAEDLGECDYVTGCAHKFGGPKGTGFLVVKEESERLEFITGGPQENRRRAGTEDVPGILAMMAALLEKSDDNLEAALDERVANRTVFESFVTDRHIASVVGPNHPRLWNTVMLIVAEHKNLKWLTRLDRRGFSVSTGSACSAGKGNPSHVMAAMGLDPDEMGRVIRISSGWDTTAADWTALAEAFVEVKEELDSGKRAGNALPA